MNAIQLTPEIRRIAAKFFEAGYSLEVVCTKKPENGGKLARAIQLGVKYPVVDLDEDGDLLIKISGDETVPVFENNQHYFSVEWSQEKLSQLIAADKAERMGNLLSLMDSYLSVEKFSVGDVLEWKPNCAVLMYPAEGVHCVVVDVVDAITPSVNELDHAHTLKLDLVVGFVDENSGDFITIRADSRRMRKVK